MNHNLERLCIKNVGLVVDFEKTVGWACTGQKRHDAFQWYCMVVLNNTS